MEKPDLRSALCIIFQSDGSWMFGLAELLFELEQHERTKLSTN